jgi:hypothetical protein
MHDVTAQRDHLKRMRAKPSVCTARSIAERHDGRSRAVRRGRQDQVTVCVDDGVLTAPVFLPAQEDLALGIAVACDAAGAKEALHRTRCFEMWKIQL